MNKKHRLLAFLLTICMLIPLVSPIAANAVSTNTISDSSTISSELSSNAVSANTISDSPTVSSELSSEDDFLSPSLEAAINLDPELIMPGTIVNESLIAFDLPISMSIEDANTRGLISRVKSAENDLHSVVFGNKDGGYTLYYYSEPVKYVDEYGVIRDKSDSFYAYMDGSFGTLANDIQTDLPRKLKDGIALYKDDIFLRMSPSEAIEAVGALSSDQKIVTYTLNDTTRYEYSLTAMGYKEDIIVNEYTGQTEYSFVLQTNGLIPVYENAVWSLRDEDGIERATIGDIILFTADERNNTFGNLQVDEIEQAQEYLLTIELDPEWLTDEKTAYPITIDPTMTLTSTGDIEDVVVGTSTTYSGTSSSLYVGRGSSGAKIRTLMRFPNLNLSGYTVNSARIELRDIMCEDTAQIVQCYEFIGTSWSESGSTSWSSIGSSPVGTKLSEESVVYGGADTSITGNKHRYAFDITSLAKKWAAGTASPSKGVIFKATDTYESSGTKTYKTFASINRSSNQPSLVIDYQTSAPSVSFTQTASSVYIGSTAQVKATASNGNTVSYSSSNTSIATISSNGLITGKASGTVTITASANGATSAKIDVKVNPVIISLTPTSATLPVGGTVQLSASTTPSGRTVTWTSSKPAVATVDANGVVTAKSGGTAIITASATGATSKTCTVTVDSNSLNISGNCYINNNLSGHFLRRASTYAVSTSIYSGSTNLQWYFELLGDNKYYIKSMFDTDYALYGSGNTVSLAILPEAPSTQYIWSIRVSAIGGVIITNVDSGLVLTYTPALEDDDAGDDTPSLFLDEALSYPNTNYSQTVWNIVPKSGYVTLTSVEASNIAWLEIGSTTQPSQVTIKPTNASWGSMSNFTWESANTKVATVDDNGKITGVGNGYTMITVMHKQTEKKYSFPIVIGQLIPNGTYQICNISSGMYMDVEGPSTSEGAYIQQWEHHNGNQANWTFTYYQSGYYYIRSLYSNKYVGVSSSTTSGDTSIIQTATASDATRWKITVTSDGNYKFTAKASETNDLALSLPSVTTTNGVNLQQCVYTDDAIFSDEWLIDKEYDVSLIAIPVTYNRTSFFENTQKNLAKLGYTTNVYAEETCMNHNFMINHMIKSKVLIIRTHGNIDRIVTSNNEITIGSISELKTDALSNCDLIIYGACLTGKGGEDATNLVNATHEKGANAVIGFPKSVKSDEVNVWIDIFINELASGKTVKNAAAGADEYIYYIWLPSHSNRTITTDNCHIAGDSSAIISNVNN